MTTRTRVCLFAKGLSIRDVLATECHRDLPKVDGHYCYFDHEAMKRGGPAAEIAFRVTEAVPELVKEMKHPIRRLARINMALPHSKPLERALIPQVDDIVEAVKEML